MDKARQSLCKILQDNAHFQWLGQSDKTYEQSMNCLGLAVFLIVVPTSTTENHFPFLDLFPKGHLLTLTDGFCHEIGSQFGKSKHPPHHSMQSGRIYETTNSQQAKSLSLSAVC